MEYKAKLIDGVLEIFPKVEKKTNSNGGTDVTVHMPSPSTILATKMEILNKLARGEKVEIEKEDKNG